MIKFVLDDLKGYSTKIYIHFDEFLFYLIIVVAGYALIHPPTVLA